MNDTKLAKTFFAADDTLFEYGFRYLKGNAKPYFFINFETYDRWGRVDSCGTPSEAQVRESAPQLANLLRWHLCDIDGRPMHYEANARYWLGQARGHGYPGPKADEAVRRFKSAVVWGASQDRDDGILLPLSADLDQWLAARFADLQADFQADLAAHGLWGPAQDWWKRLQA